MSKNIFFLFFFLFPFLVSAQTEEATTDSGKKVILYPDGTWKIKPVTNSGINEEKKDSRKNTNPLPVDLNGDCGEVFETIKDKNNTVIVRTKNFLVVTRPEDKTELDISIQKGAKGIITLSLRSGLGSECIGEGNRISIFFTDDTKLELNNEGATNCRGEAIAYFSGPYGKKKQLEELRVKKIKSVKIWTQQGSFTQFFSSENQDELIRLINCIMAV